VYRGRWGIETGYRVKKGFLARTAVRSIGVRLFLFLVSMLLQNAWELLGRGRIEGRRGEEDVTADLFRDRMVRLLLSRLPAVEPLPEAPW